MKAVFDARFALLLNQPWLAAALLRLPLVEVMEAGLVPTLATDGRAVYFSPAFCASLTHEDLQFCLAHELMHCLLDHLPRMGSRDPALWNVAVDLVTNRLLEKCGFRVPSGALQEASVWFSLDHRTAEEVYDQLAGTTEESKALAAKWLRLRSEAPLRDQHGGTADVLARMAAMRPEDAPSDAELQVIRHAVVRDSAGHHQGWGGVGGIEELSRAGRPRVPWRVLLASFLTGLQRNDYRWIPPAKRHLWRGLVLPSATVSGPAHVVVAIDTSGSMGVPLLRRILAEIDGMRRQWSGQLTVIDCDEVVRNVRVYDAFEPIDFDAFELRGRGGTSFVPVFVWLEEKVRLMDGPAPDVLVYFTDGYGEFPEKEPGIPVCWIMPDDGEASVPFGQVIQLDAQE